MNKIIVTLTSAAGIFLLSATAAFAHVIVYPNHVGVAATQEFSMAVPTEKDNSTVAIKLLIPDGLQMVVPNAKAGWTIAVKKNGTGDTAPVTEIDWTGGSIPVGQRDDFLFQAQVPAKETTLQWKAYQTYQDGSVVAWDHAPSKDPTDDSAPPPYSTTKIVNDLTGSGASTGMMVKQTSTNTNAPMMDYSSKRAMLPLGLGVIAIVLSVISLGVVLRKK